MKKNFLLINILLLLAACAPTRQSIQTAIAETQAALPTSTPPPGSTLTPEVTRIPAFTLSGVIFFDYNGNGNQDENEPGLPNVTVQVGDLGTTTANDGSYTLVGLNKGDQQVRISAPDFHYVSLSVDSFQSMDDPLSIMIESNSQQNWGLMQGFLTLPITSDTPIKIDRMYDHSPGHEVLWWDGVHPYDPNDTIFYAVPPGTNEHAGIDYNLPSGTNVISAAPGVVWKIFEDCGGVMLLNGSIGGRPIYTFYTHTTRILVSLGETVARGEIIGYSGSKCTPYPHLHFDVRSAPDDTDYWAYLDPYSPIVPVPTGFWLSGDPLPVWTDEYHPANGLSLWTVWNSPQFAK